MSTENPVYICIVRDPQLNNAVILYEFLELESPEEFSKEDIMYNIASDFNCLKPFLDKFGLFVEFFDGKNQRMNLLEAIRLHPDADSGNASLVLPPLWAIKDTYQVWVDCYPWMHLANFELCLKFSDFQSLRQYPEWEYSRTRRELALKDKPNYLNF